MRQLLLILAAMTLIPLPLAADVAQPPSIIRTNAPLPDDVRLVKNVEMGHGGDQTLYADLAIPKHPPATPMPAILIVHGGGWRAGTRQESFTLAYFLASHGYFLASIDYRLRPKYKWPAQIEDCKLAVRWLRANAARYNIDPNRIGCWGHSAGGHLVACMGTMDDPKLEGTGGYPGVSSRVQAVADFSGGEDFTLYGSGIPLGAVSAKQAHANLEGINDLLGATREQNPAIWRAASPINFIKPNDPPFLLVHGTLDPLVPFPQATQFDAALKKAGVPVKFIVVQGGNHGLFAPPGHPPSTPNGDQLRAATVAFFDKYLKKK